MSHTHQVVWSYNNSVLFQGDEDDCERKVRDLIDDEGYEEGDLEVEELDPNPICPSCDGSGEGQWDGSRCYRCKGRGTL